SDHRRETQPVIPTCVARDDTQQVARVEIEAKRLPARASIPDAVEMPEYRPGFVAQTPARGAKPQRDVQIFGVGEQRAVEECSADGVNRAERHEQRAAGRE